ncbi:MAG: MarR family transcriptional regulator [Denitrovibrio sp.]|nr:MAG: MarR family transcriptional regulator [Denitrovibrio sp.]
MKEYNDTEMLNMRLVSSLYRSLKALRRKEFAKISETGVTFAQFEVLVIAYHFGPLTVGNIIDRTLSSIGNISLVISNLVKDGYLQSIISEKDRRSKLISLTDKGLEFMEDFFPVHLENLDGILSIYTDDEKEMLLHLVKKLYKQ